MLPNIRLGNTLTNVTTNISRTFECHPDDQHGHLLLGIASAGVMANLSVAGLIMARKALRRWSSGLLIHGTIVDGSRSALLIPLAISAIKCQPVTRCSIIDTTFLLLATVSCLNLLTSSLSDAPLLPPPILAPSLLRSVGFNKAKQSPHKFTSPLYPKSGPLFYSDFYEEDANLLDETTAMPDSPQCVLFGSFMVWFAALTINLGPTFLSGALAAQSELTPDRPGCPLVRGPNRHVVLNILWAAVNLLCIALTISQLRKLRRDLTRARIGLLAAAGAGLAGMAGIAQSDPSLNPFISAHAKPSNSLNGSSNAIGGPSTSSVLPINPFQAQRKQTVNGLEIDVFLRRAQRAGHSHIRTLGTLAALNLICWIPIYVCSLVVPVGTGIWEDPAPIAYEITLITAFTHSAIHPLFLLFLHDPLRQGLKECIIDSCCCLCQWVGLEFHPRTESEPPSPDHVRDYDKSIEDTGGFPITSSSRLGASVGMLPSTSIPHSNIRRSSKSASASGSHPHLHSVMTAESVLPFGSRSMESLNKSSRRTPSFKSNRSFSEVLYRPNSSGSCHLMLDEDGLPPPPLPPANVAFRKQVSMEFQKDRGPESPPPMLNNRW